VGRPPAEGAVSTTGPEPADGQPTQSARKQPGAASSDHDRGDGERDKHGDPEPWRGGREECQPQDREPEQKDLDAAVVDDGRERVDGGIAVGGPTVAQPVAGGRHG
jgi:hypothetical protein